MGMLMFAERIFVETSEKNIVAWTLMIIRYAHNSLPEEAVCLFDFFDMGLSGNKSLLLKYKGLPKLEMRCNILLIPSRFESCGLNQLYAMRYRTVPVANSTGFRDTIENFDPYASKGSGKETRISKRGNTKFQNYILTDVKFSEALSVNDVYYLSNARILKIPQEYRLVDNDYQIIFHGGTTIEQLPVESFVLPEQRSNFVSLQDLGALKDLKNFDSTLHTIGLTSNAPTPEMIKDISTIFEFFDGSKKQQDPQGKYCETVALKVYPDCELVPYKDIQTVCEAIEGKLVNEAVIPVREIRALSFLQGVHIVGEDQVFIITRFLILARELIVPRTADKPIRNGYSGGRTVLHRVNNRRFRNEKWFNGLLINVELEVSLEDENMKAALTDLKEFTTFTRVLGCYPVDEMVMLESPKYSECLVDEWLQIFGV
ncbi:hypothetical protein QJS10_CPB21g00073 [Acorus calamus]|uniref:Uncharacterized protein n=1 Tax=Acorus calamus TaxID=4465 RepID=A0AAV9C7G2_ACOCL|nr:hypothetical protein QJS10_CPB21g00073 [Acorus calamus]